MKNWLTVAQAAPKLGLSQQALYTAIRERQIPAIRIGRRIRLEPEALLAWATKQCNIVTPAASTSEDNGSRVS